jgi:hypothetical protein
MRLEKIVETKTTNDVKYTLVYIPTLMDLKKEVQLKVCCSDPYETPGNIGLPNGLNDTVVVYFSQREEQTSLPKEA